MASIPIFDISGAPLLEAGLLRSLLSGQTARLTGSILTRAAPVVGGAVLAAKVVNEAAEFQSRHPAMNIDPLEVISNPLMRSEQKR